MVKDLVPQGYTELLADRKQRIQQARVRAALAVNREGILLYWQIGREILQRQREEGWGAKIIDRLARDLRLEFPQMTGSHRATSSTCVRSPRHTPTSQLCTNLLHNYLGLTTVSCSTR